MNQSTHYYRIVDVKDETFSYNMATGDETCFFFQYNPEIKRPNARWKASDEPKKSRLEKSKCSYMLQRNNFCEFILFFWIIYEESWNA